MSIPLDKLLMLGGLIGSKKVKSERDAAALAKKNENEVAVARAKATAEAQGKIAVKKQEGANAIALARENATLDEQGQYRWVHTQNGTVMYTGTPNAPNFMYKLEASKLSGDNSWSYKMAPPVALAEQGGRIVPFSSLSPQQRMTSPQIGSRSRKPDGTFTDTIYDKDKRSITDPPVETKQLLFNGEEMADVNTMNSAIASYGTGGNAVVKTTTRGSVSGDLISTQTAAYIGAADIAKTQNREVAVFRTSNGKEHRVEMGSEAQTAVFAKNGITSLEDIPGGADILSKTMVGGKEVFTLSKHFAPHAGVKTTSVKFTFKADGQTFEDRSQDEMNQILSALGKTSAQVGYRETIYSEQDGNTTIVSTKYIDPTVQTKAYGMITEDEVTRYVTAVNEKQFSLKFPTVEMLGFGKFSGDVFVEDAAKSVDDEEVTFRGNDGKLVTKLFSKMSEDEKELTRLSSTPVTIVNPGLPTEIVTARGESKSLTQQMSNPAFGSGIVIGSTTINVDQSTNPLLNLTTLAGQIDNDVLAELNADDVLRLEFFDRISDFVHTNSLAAQGTNENGFSLLGRPNQIYKPSNRYLKDMKSRLLEMKGFEEYLFKKNQRELETIKAQKVIDVNEGEDGTVKYVVPTPVNPEITDVNEALSQGEDIALPVIEVSDAHANVVNNVIMPVLNIVHKDPAKAEDLVFNNLVDYELQPRQDADGFFERASDIQPKIAILRNFHNVRTASGGTYLMNFVNMVNNGLSFVSSDQHKYFAARIVGDLDLEGGVNLITAYIGPSTVLDSREYIPPAVRESMELYGLGLFRDRQTVNARQNAITVKNSALRGKDIALKIDQSYVATDGGLLPSSAVVNAGIGISGGIYFIREGIGQIAEIAGLGNVADLANDLMGRTPS